MEYTLHWRMLDDCDYLKGHDIYILLLSVLHFTVNSMTENRIFKFGFPIMNERELRIYVK